MDTNIDNAPTRPVRIDESQLAIINKKKQINKLEEMRLEQIGFSSTLCTQIDCVIHVLSESIERVKISLILPKLLENPRHLKEVLKGTKYEQGVSMVNDFMRRRDIIVKEKRPPLMDHGMIKIIDYFQRNYSIYQLFPKVMSSLTREERKLLLAFEMLFNIACQHLLRTSKSEITKERKLHQMYRENESLKASISELRAKLRSQKVTLRWKMAAKEAYIRKYDDDLAYKKWQNNVRIQNEIEKCSRVIRTNHKASLEKQQELEKELEKSRSEYEKETKQNLIAEREARAEKNKLLLQLQSLLKKYDNSIGEKMRENLRLEDDFNEAKKQFDDFMVFYHAEEAIYNDIVVKREEEERREQQRRIVVFMMNRAARKIQKYWRKWRKDQRKKNKRLKKGKKK
ncbi:golgin subfamily A member 6-like protein 22 isoform X1 [Scaptodrosophila lebanonensis]|uniref:Dynein regulatory complex protein 10 n=1 Tax=Drosophila lebanonensis TaxID=7225 RepID=A0A6J2T7L0_DROLE|nr:golgin subfamily A member 6-like protein 22 isoform X1 [Scaptodrosophila lebanonensis]